MKLCRIIDDFPTGDQILGDLGPNYYHYAKGTTAAGIEEHIICQRKKGQPKKEEIEGFTVWRVAPADTPHPRRDMLFGEFAKKSLEKVLELKPDIVHGHNSIHYAIARNKKKLEEKGIKLLTHLHIHVDMFRRAEHFPLFENPSFALRERALDLTYFLQFMPCIKNADRIIACDKSVKKSTLNYVSDIPIDVVYNGVSFAKFRKTKSEIKKELGAEKLLLNICRPVPWKGLQYLLRAMPAITREFSGTKLLLLGVERPEYKVYLDWLKAIAKKHGVKNAEFGGRIPYFDLPKYYSAADCFVAPSFPDPSPKTVYEAQACGCPVAGVGGEKSGIQEIFGKESGLLFKPRNVTDLAEKVSYILKNSSKFHGGRNAIKQRATWQKCVSDMIEVYDKILK